MWYVYILRSKRHPDQRYVGLTNNLEERLERHNQGRSPHTAKYRPWKLDVLTGFADKARAVAFERYLKTGSGFAFAKRHF